MSQDAGDMRSRAISTAKFLMVSQASPPKQRDVWDAAERKVITLTESPITYDDSDLCTPSQNPSKPSLMDFISGKSGRLDGPASPETSSNPAPMRSTGSHRNTRASLTGYQWTGGSPTAVDSSGYSSQTSADHDSVLSSDPCRSRSIDIQRQQASQAAVADEQQGSSRGRGFRRHSVQFPATPEYFAKLNEQPGSPGRTAAESPDAEQAPTAKVLNGRSRRASLLGFSTTTALAEAADAASVNHYMSSLNLNAPRRSRSLEVTATPPDGSVTPALTSSASLPAGRSPGPGRSNSRMLQVSTASALSSVGTAAAPVEPAAPLNSAARGPAAVPMLKGFSRTSSTCNRPVLSANSNNADTSGQAAVNAGPGYKPFVPSIDWLDQRALERPAESDCTAYNVFLPNSVRH